LAKVSSEKMVSLMPQLIESTIKYCKLDDDDLREQCLQSLEVFVQNSVTVDECLDTVIDLSVEYLSFDPNYIDNGDDYEMSEDDEEYLLVSF
jgi:cullin-associated NEDD8-dissociated protein 1